MLKNLRFGYFLLPMVALTIIATTITAILSFLIIYYTLINSPNVFQFFNSALELTPELNREPEPSIPTLPPPPAQSPESTFSSLINRTITSANVTSIPISGLALTNATSAFQIINATFESSELEHGPIITAPLDSGAIVRISWLLKQGQNLSFTINTDTEGITYTLDSPSRNLHKDLVITSPFSYRESGHEEGLYTLRLRNTGIFSNGVITHVVPNASDVVLSSPVSLNQTVTQGFLNRGEPVEPINQSLLQEPLAGTLLDSQSFAVIIAAAISAVASIVVGFIGYKKEKEKPTRRPVH